MNCPSKEMISFSKKVYALILVLVLIGCSSSNEIEVPEHIRKLENLTIHSADVQPNQAIQLTREQTFGNSEDVLIGTITDITVDEQGRVYIADGQQLTIYVYNSNGRYVTQLGDKGRGPGEFQNIYFLTSYKNQLYAYDYQQRRIYVFSLGSFTLSHTINLNPENWSHINGLKNSFPTRFFVRNDRTLLMRFTQIRQPDQYNEQTYNKHFLLNEKGEIISDLVYKQKGVEYLISNWGGNLNLLKPPFTRSSLMAVFENGTIFSAWSEEFLIKVYSPNGNYMHAFYHPYKQSLLNLQSFLDLYNEQPSLQQSYRSSELPNTWPALNQILLDDENRLWVSTITDNEEYYLWWVLDEDGELLARFKWPGVRLGRDISKLNRVKVKNGFFYAIENNKKTGLQEVVRYRIKLNKL